MINYLYLTLFFVILCLNSIKSETTFNSFKEVVHFTTARFINKFFISTNSTVQHGAFDILSYYERIFNYSFTMKNNLGDYNECLNSPNMNYYYILFIDKDFKEASNAKLSNYFKKLIFRKYFSFGICLPVWMKLNDNNLVNITELFQTPNFYVNSLKSQFSSGDNPMYLFRSHLMTGKEYVNQYSMVTFFTIFGVFGGLSVFFGIFPEYQKFRRSVRCFCRKKKKRKVNESFNLGHEKPDESPNILRQDTDESVFKLPTKEMKLKKEVYKFFSSIFNISKNVNRFYKKPGEHSCYSNDHSLAFINGLKGANLFLFTFCAIFWMMIENPILNININALKSKVLDNGFLPLVSLLYASLYFNFSLSGFLLSYKFLSCMSKFDNQDKDNPKMNSLTNRILYFFLPLISRYVFYLFLLLLVSNLNIILNLTVTHKGPLMKIYDEIQESTLNNFPYYILPLANFVNNDEIQRNSIYIYSFIFIAEFYYFFASFILLLIYFKKPKLGFYLFISSFIVLVITRTVLFAMDERDFRDIFGFDINFYNIQFGFPLYLLGNIFGILYFEYNCHIPELEFSSLPYDLSYQYLDIDANTDRTIPMVSYHENTSIKMNKIFKIYSPAKILVNLTSKSNFIQTTILIISTLLFAFVIVYDFAFLFQKVRENVFYKFNTFEKIYTFLELEIFIFLIFCYIFKFAIFQNSTLKNFLESHNWTVFARSFNSAIALICPVTYFYLLTQDYPVSFEYFYVYCLSISTLVILLMLSWGIIITVEIPLKTAMKKYTKFSMKNRLKEK